MRQLHAWECRCGVRNAPQFGQCRRCGIGRSSGKPIYAQGAHAPAPRGERVGSLVVAAVIWPLLILGVLAAPVVLAAGGAAVLWAVLSTPMGWILLGLLAAAVWYLAEIAGSLKGAGRPRT